MMQRFESYIAGCRVARSDFAPGEIPSDLNAPAVEYAPVAAGYAREAVEVSHAAQPGWAATPPPRVRHPRPCRRRVPGPEERKRWGG